MSKKEVIGYLYTHPACACGATIDMVKNYMDKYDEIKIKEISLVDPLGRKESYEHGVKTIPSLYFIKSGKLLVTSDQITIKNIEDELINIGY